MPSSFSTVCGEVRVLWAAGATAGADEAAWWPARRVAGGLPRLVPESGLIAERLKIRAKVNWMWKKVIPRGNIQVSLDLLRG